MSELARKLKQQEGVEQVVPFGNILHVSGHDGAQLEAAIAPFRNGDYRWEPSEANLEETFISLMQGHEEP
jgi:ABC-2 type transport system ATP-binding protein